MFDVHESNLEFDFEQILEETPNIENVIRGYTKLPRLVRRTTISKYYERVIDDDELDRLTSVALVDCSKVEEVDRLMLRKRVLSSYLGRELVCAVINVPGLCYSIEVDPNASAVVHWECIDCQA